DAAPDAEAAAQPLDQPGAKRVEARDLGHVDEDVGPAAAELFGIGDDLLQHGGMAGDPGTGRAKRKRVAPCNLPQSRVAVHAATPGAPTPRSPAGSAACRPPLHRTVMYQPLLVTASQCRIQKS